ncbi:MAG: tetratricopeptide repeat protein [Crocinitomix sp.]|nr:tetratricopeptide repeat protein [Crocinitomix sp.]
MKIIITVFLVGFSLTCAKAQTNLDSLLGIWQDDSQIDSNRIKAYYDYIYKGFLYNNPDTAFTMTEELVQFTEENQYPNYKRKLGDLRNMQGISFHLSGNYPKSIEYYQRSVKIQNEIGNKQGAARPLSNIGYTYFTLGNNVMALEYYQRGLKINKEIGKKRGYAINLINIGLVYADQHDYTEALSYYERSLKINEEIENKQEIVNCLTNIGVVHADQGNYTEALDYYERSLKIGQEIGAKRRVALSLNNIGLIYADQANYHLALDYYLRSIKIREEVGDKNGIAASSGNIGLVYKEQGVFNDAIAECSKSFNLSKEIGSLGQQKKACSCLYEAYKGLGKGIEALTYLEKMLVIEDSLNAQETGKKLLQMEFQKQVLIDSVANVEKERLVEEEHEEEVKQKNRTRNGLLITGGFFVLLAGGFYARWRFVKKAKAVVEYEKDRSENLLLNILPAEIAEELKAKGSADARDFDIVSILFTDFKGFTAASEKLSAQELVAEINVCFEAFDGIITKYNIEKIKTIGDAYMAAGGLPVPFEDSIKNTLFAALEMQAFISKRKIEMDHKGLPAFEMRVGVHTGPVVAGIVGVKKFQYDIWGDTVNTASRMESSGEVGKVNISQATYEMLKNNPDFTFESRGKIEAKGKGELEMYFVSRSLGLG